MLSITFFPALAQGAQWSCGLSIPGSVQGQVARGSEQSGLVENVPAYGTSSWNWMIFIVPSHPNCSVIPWHTELSKFSPASGAALCWSSHILNPAQAKLHLNHGLLQLHPAETNVQTLVSSVRVKMNSYSKLTSYFQKQKFPLISLQTANPSPPTSPPPSWVQTNIWNCCALGFVYAYLIDGQRVRNCQIILLLVVYIN